MGWDHSYSNKRPLQWVKAKREFDCAISSLVFIFHQVAAAASQFSVFGELSIHAGRSGDKHKTLAYIGFFRPLVLLFDMTRRRMISHMMPKGRLVDNLYADLPDAIPTELVETLAGNASCRIERIVSTGQASPPGFWYDQPEVEWVVVLKGEAHLRFEDAANPILMKPGDYLLIQPHRKHRVEGTSQEEPTVWLAVFLSD